MASRHPEPEGIQALDIGGGFNRPLAVDRS
jgi:hypothetical protein